MKVQRERFQTQLDPDVLSELIRFAKQSNIKTVNKVIEALTRNFLKYLDEDGNVKFDFFKTTNEIPPEAMQLIVEKFAAFLEEERKRGGI